MALPQVTGDDRTVRGADRNSIGAHAAVALLALGLGLSCWWVTRWRG